MKFVYNLNHFEGNSTTVRPDNYNDMVAKANIGAAALKAYKGKREFFFLKIENYLGKKVLN